jgi:uncharacterized protein YneF (UPF0154 family)
MTVVWIVLGVLAVLLVVFFVGGYIASRRKLMDPRLEEHIRAADQALERARAQDRGWDRALLEEAARGALRDQRPDVDYDQLHLVLVDDRPGVEEDRAHMMAMGHTDQARVVLTRTPGGEWILERIE